MNITSTLSSNSVILSGGEVLRTAASFSPKSVVLSAGEALHTAINFSLKAVIMSAGEPVNSLSSQDSPEPQSKDLARPSAGFEKRNRISFRRVNPTLIAPRKMASSSRDKNTRFACHNRLIGVPSSFDCGSGQSVAKTASLISPPLRMTDFFLKFNEGATS